MDKIPFKDIGVARIFRYSYGGLLLMVLIAINFPLSLSPIIEALGLVLAPLTAIAIGTGIYIIHRYVIGEIFLYPFLNIVHNILDRIRKRKGLLTTNPLNYLHFIGVEKTEQRAAYLAVRSQLFNPSEKKELDVAHSELHILWITVDELLVTAFYLQAKHLTTHYFFSISILVAFCAIVADIRQHQLECHKLKITNNKEKLLPFLKEMGYLKTLEHEKMGVN